MPARDKVYVDIVAETKKAVGNMALLTVGVAAAAAGLRVLKDFAVDAFKAFENQEQVTIRLEAALKATGNAVGISAGQMGRMSEELDRMTQFSDDVITNAQGLLVTFTNIGQDVFPQALEAAMDLSTMFGTDLKQATIQLGKALNDPIKGMSALADTGITFSQEQKDLIRSFQEVNDIASAQAVILDELEREFGGVAIAMGEAATAGVKAFDDALLDLKENVGKWFAITFKDSITFITQKMEEMADLAGRKELAELWIESGRNVRAFDDDLEGLLDLLVEANKVEQDFLDISAGSAGVGVRRRASQERIDSTNVYIDRIRFLMEVQQGQRDADAEAARIQAGLDAEQARRDVEQLSRAKSLTDWLDIVNLAFARTGEAKLEALQASLAWFKQEQEGAVATAHLFPPIIEMLQDQIDLLDGTAEAAKNAEVAEIERLQNVADKLREKAAEEAALLEERSENWNDFIQGVMDKQQEKADEEARLAEEALTREELNNRNRIRAMEDGLDKELELLQVRLDNEIENAEEIGADTADIIKFYLNEEVKLREEAVDRILALKAEIEKQAEIDHQNELDRINEEERAKIKAILLQIDKQREANERLRKLNEDMREKIAIMEEAIAINIDSRLKLMEEGLEKELLILQFKEEAEIEVAERVGANVWAIEEIFRRKRLAAIEEVNEIEIELFEDQQERFRNILQDSLTDMLSVYADFAERRAEMLTEAFDAQIETEEDASAARIETLEAEAEARQVITDAETLTAERRYEDDVEALQDAARAELITREELADALDALSDARRDRVRDTQDAELTGETALADAIEAITTDLADAKLTIYDENQAAINEALTRQALAEKASALISIAISTSVAAMKAFEQLGVFGAPAALAIGVAGLAQAALVISQPLPSFATGTDFVTNGEQFIKVGDNPGGRERVTVEPLSSPNINGPSDMNHIIINLDGAVIQEFISKSTRNKKIQIYANSIVS